VLLQNDPTRTTYRPVLPLNAAALRQVRRVRACAGCCWADPWVWLRLDMPPLPVSGRTPASCGLLSPDPGGHGMACSAAVGMRTNVNMDAWPTHNTPQVCVVGALADSKEHLLGNYYGKFDADAVVTPRAAITAELGA
jgi:hypothetical protein